MRKGISPLVAAVILIATTMSIAGILSYWATSFVRTRLVTAENETERTECLAAQFRIYLVDYDNVTNNMKIILENQRNIDLKLTDLYLFYDSDLEIKPLDDTLEGNALKSINVTNIEDNFDKGVIKTNCADVSTEFSYAESQVA